ncbi:MAG: hypothetical protein ACW98I_21060 [Candidatus Hodarchaeales archaeon]
MHRKPAISLGYLLTLFILIILAIAFSENGLIWYITTMWFGFGAVYVLLTYNKFRRPLTLVESLQIWQYQSFKRNLQKKKN